LEILEQQAVNTATVAAVENRPPDLFVTRAMLQQRKAAPDLQAEAAAFCELSKILADNPCVALRHLLDIARGSCHAGSAGLSLLREDSAGQTVVHWAAISGALASHEGTDTPRDSSPCGLCLDSGTTIRVSRPQRAFASLRDTQPEIVEDLIVPLYDNASKPLGTLWIAHHDRKSHFCADDARVAEQLAAQSVLALNLLERAKDHQYAMALRESHQVAQQQLLVHDLAEERGLRECAEAMEGESRRALVFKDAMLHEVNHRTKNTLQAAGSLLVLHASATPSTQVRMALLDSYARLQLLAKVHELLCTKTDGAQTVLMPGLLQTLADGLRHSFAKTAAHVGLQLTSDPISLPVDQAIPLALLANEVVTNAYKHAFPSDAAGEITMSLQHTPTNGLTLRIADTGIGLYPTGSEIGMGLKLIRTLAAQLRGTLLFATLPAGVGTEITLTIRPPTQA
jgi:two-component sensor histidine kinase